MPSLLGLDCEQGKHMSRTWSLYSEAWRDRQKDDSAPEFVFLAEGTVRCGTSAVTLFSLAMAWW